MEGNAPVESTGSSSQTQPPGIESEVYKAPESSQNVDTTSSTEEHAKKITDYLDDGDERKAKAALLECVKDMSTPEEVKALFKEMQKHDDVNVGLDITFYDSNNQASDLSEAQKWSFEASPSSQSAEYPATEKPEDRTVQPTESQETQNQEDLDSDVKEIVRIMDEEGDYKKAQAAVANMITETSQKMQQDPTFDGQEYLREKFRKIDALDDNEKGVNANLVDANQMPTSAEKAVGIAFTEPENKTNPEAPSSENSPESQTPDEPEPQEPKEVPTVDQVVEMLDVDKDMAKADAAIKQLIKEQKLQEIYEIDSKEVDGKGQDLIFVDKDGKPTKVASEIADYRIEDGEVNKETTMTPTEDKGFVVEPPPGEQSEKPPETTPPSTDAQDPNALPGNGETSVTPEDKIPGAETNPENPNDSSQGEKPNEVSEAVKNIVNLLDVDKDISKAKEAIQTLMNTGDSASLLEVYKQENKEDGLNLVFLDESGNHVNPFNEDGSINMEQKIASVDVVPSQNSAEKPNKETNPEATSENNPEVPAVAKAAHPLLQTNIFIPESERPELFSLIDKAGDTDKENEQNDGLISKGDLSKVIDNKWFSVLDQKSQDFLKNLKDADWNSEEFKALKQDGYLSLEKIKAAGDNLPETLKGILDKSYMSEETNTMTLHSLIDRSKGNEDERKDGKVNSGDLNDLRKNKMKFLLAKDSQDYVEVIRQEYMDSSQNVTKMQDKEGYITVETINLALARDAVNGDSSKTTNPEATTVTPTPESQPPAETSPNPNVNPSPEPESQLPAETSPSSSQEDTPTRRLSDTTSF